MDARTHCVYCKEKGKKGGCPVCGMFPEKKDIIINDIKYHFVGNWDTTESNFTKLQNMEEIRIVVGKALSRLNIPVHIAYPEHKEDEIAGVWIACDDLSSASKHFKTIKDWL